MVILIFRPFNFDCFCNFFAGLNFCFLHAYLVSNLHEFALVKTSYSEEMATIITLPINATYLFKVIFPSWYGKGVACSALLMLIFFTYRTRVSDVHTALLGRLKM